MNSDWLVPQWPVPAQVHALCTTRAGGSSMAPFDALNLADHVGDSQLAVAANRALLQHAMKARPVFLSQVHGTAVALLSASTPSETRADACLTDQSGVACTIMVADCLPVLLTNRQGSAVGAAHAGWRGLAGQDGQGILESALASFAALCSLDGRRQAAETVVWLGPCIGPNAFEVGEDVRDAFVAHDREAAQMFRRQSGDKWLADLAGLARLRLAALGVTQIHGNDGGAAWCTASNPSRYFSHRRDRVSGRMAACIWLS